MAMNDINSISPVESSQNIIIPQKKKEKKKSKKEKLHKPADNAEENQDNSENDQQDVMANNDEHLLDFKA